MKLADCYLSGNSHFKNGITIKKCNRYSECFVLVNSVCCSRFANPDKKLPVITLFELTKCGSSVDSPGTVQEPYRTTFNSESLIHF